MNSHFVLYNKICLDVMRDMKSKSVDLVLTDKATCPVMAYAGRSGRDNRLSVSLVHYWLHNKKER